MFNYIKAELYRIFHGVSFYVITAIMFVYQLILLSVVKVIKVLTFWDFIFANSSFANSSLNLGLVLVIIFSMTIFGSEFRNNTMKNVIGAGVSKSTVFFGKYLISLVLSILIYLVPMHIVACARIPVGGIGKLNSLAFDNLLLSILYFALFSFAFCGIEHLIQSSGGVMAMAIVSYFALPTICQVLIAFNRNLRKVLAFEWNTAVADITRHGWSTMGVVHLVVSGCIMIGIGIACYGGYLNKDIK